MRFLYKLFMKIIILFIPIKGNKIFLIKSNSLNNFSNRKSDIFLCSLFSNLKIFLTSSFDIQSNINPKNMWDKMMKLIVL